MKWFFILLLCFVVGLLRMGVEQSKLKRFDLSGQTVFRAVVNQPAVNKNGNQILVVTEEETKVELKVSVAYYPRYSYGDNLLIEGTLNEFGWIYQPSKVEKMGRDRGTMFMNMVYGIRGVLEEKIDQVFIGTSASLVAGIVFGIDRDLGSDLDQKVREVGLVHVLVASGYNVSILIGFFAFITKYLGKRVSILITILAVVIYAGVAGFGAPIVRAALMGIATLIAVILGRQKDAYLWLMFSAFIMLLFRPSLYESLSFQLSFLATFGILVFNSRVEHLLLFFPKMIREESATTISVQVLTTPWLWLQMGVFQPLSILVNMLTLWVIPIVMFGSIVIILVSFVQPDFAKLVAVPIHLLLSYIIWIVNAFAQ